MKILYISPENTVGTLTLWKKEHEARGNECRTVTFFASPKNFEEASARLEEIVEVLEDGELTLEDAISLYEEGVKLFRFTQDQLNFAQKKIEELTIDDDGAFSIRPFDEKSEGK